MARAARYSPYLSHPRRLGDVLAAIQSMGTYKFYKLDFETWADRISGDAKLGDYWRTVIEQHPEFFRLDRSRTCASLIWRRQYPKLFHVDLERKLTREELAELNEEQRKRVSRNPLTPGDIQALMKTAIDLHTRAFDHQREKRWWLPLATGFAALLGALVGALLQV